jgi:hypothetical protein
MSRILIVEDTAKNQEAARRGVPGATIVGSVPEGISLIDTGDYDYVITGLFLSGGMKETGGEDVVAACVAKKIPVVVLTDTYYHDSGGEALCRISEVLIKSNKCVLPVWSVRYYGSDIPSYFEGIIYGAVIYFVLNEQEFKNKAETWACVASFIRQIEDWR